MTPERKRRVMMLIGTGRTGVETYLGATDYVADTRAFELILIPGSDAGPYKTPLPRQADGLLLHTYAVSRVVKRRVRAPCVYLQEDDPTIKAPSVAIDTIAIGRMAAEHLLARGYRQLAFVGGSSLRFFRQRGQGFYQTAREHGLSVHEHQLSIPLVTYRWFREAKNRNGLKRFLMALPQPCGIFAANDTIAWFLIEIARSCGLAVPERLGIIGVDDDPVANASSPLGISSVQMPFREMGRRAAETLHRLMLGKPCPHRRLLAPIRVAVRASTDTFMTADPLLQRAQRYIEANRQRKVRVAEVVRALNTTRFTLDRRFTRDLATTPANYILRRRIEQAKELLRGGTLNVTEVSEACEFHSRSYFCQVFKSVTGSSPSAFRAHDSQRFPGVTACPGCFGRRRVPLPRPKSDFLSIA